MEEKKFIKVFRTAKIIQLCIVLAIELAFFSVLSYNTVLRKHIYSNEALFFLCLVTWGLMIFTLVCLLYDFYKLRVFANEHHALHQEVFLDELTGMPNRHSLDTLFQTYNTRETCRGLSCSSYSISNLKEINMSLGRNMGDVVIRDFSSIFEEIGDIYGFVGRNGGNEFVVIISDSSAEKTDEFDQKLKQRIGAYNESHSDIEIRLMHAIITAEEIEAESVIQLMTTAHNRLFAEQ